MRGPCRAAGVRHDTLTRAIPGNAWKLHTMVQRREKGPESRRLACFTTGVRDRIAYPQCDDTSETTALLWGYLTGAFPSCADATL